MPIYLVRSCGRNGGWCVSTTWPSFCSQRAIHSILFPAVSLTRCVRRAHLLGGRRERENKRFEPHCRLLPDNCISLGSSSFAFAPTLCNPSARGHTICRYGALLRYLARRRHRSRLFSQITHRALICIQTAIHYHTRATLAAKCNANTNRNHLLFIAHMNRTRTLREQRNSMPSRPTCACVACPNISR